MYEYHGWLSTHESLNEKEIINSLKSINGTCPVSVQYVNGKLHISFSGNPNRDTGQIKNILNYLCGLNSKLSGCIYINDSNSYKFNKFDVIKIINDVIIKIEDQNFTNEETKLLFE